jgi:hypothetical protein
MSKQVQMTFKVEPELRASFARAASLDNRSAAQLLREFMQTYIGENRLQRISRPEMGPDEQRKRQQAVDFARASVGLEGLHLPLEAEAQAQLFVNGVIGLPEFVTGMTKPR